MTKVISNGKSQMRNFNLNANEEFFMCQTSKLVTYFFDGYTLRDFTNNSYAQRRMSLAFYVFIPNLHMMMGRFSSQNLGLCYQGVLVWHIRCLLGFFPFFSFLFNFWFLRTTSPYSPSFNLTSQIPFMCFEILRLLATNRFHLTSSLPIDNLCRTRHEAKFYERSRLIFH